MGSAEAPVEFGKRIITESYYDNKLRSVKVTQTESLDALDSLHAQEIAVKKVMDLIRAGVAEDAIDVHYDIDNITKEVKRVHITYTIMKQHTNA